MKTVLSFAIPLILALVIFLGFVFFLNQKEGKGALQVTSLPQSDVYVNGKLVGSTPLCKCEANDMLATGEHSLKLVPKTPDLQPFEDKISINKSTLTVVDRTFAKGGESEGSIITLSKIHDKKDAQVLVLSFPDKATVFLDNNPAGSSPLFLKSVTESDHELRIEKEGYNEKLLRIRPVKDYKLTSLIFLGLAPVVSSESASLADESSFSIQKILILDTPTGFLRVREEATLNSPQIGQGSPGETYELLDEKNGWFQIKFNSPAGTESDSAGEEKMGWVSSQYAKKQ